MDETTQQSKTFAMDYFGTYDVRVDGQDFVASLAAFLVTVKSDLCVQLSERMHVVNALDK
jgi:hypothetical protein